MSRLSLVVAVDAGGGIGKGNQLLCHLPADLAHFKALTLGKAIIMGRRTYDSIGRALPGRMNLVLSRAAKEIAGVTVVSSLEEARRLTAALPEVMVIGGHDVFQDALPYAHRLYQTLIHHRFDADVFFPPMDWDAWTLITSTKYVNDEKNAYDMTFNCYERSLIDHREETKE